MISPDWRRAERARALLSANPAALGGLWLRARSGPVRDLFLAGLTAPLPIRRIHPTISDDALFGGIDLTETLASGHMVQRGGVLSTPALLILPMAERTPPGLAARLAAALDAGTHALIALDEGAEAEEALPPALAERLALHLDLTNIPLGDARDIPAISARPGPVAAPAAALSDLTKVALRLGIDSLRAPSLALHAARLAAALDGREEVAEADLILATELVLAPRATIASAPEDEEEEDTPPPPPDNPSEDQSEDKQNDQQKVPEEVLLEAAKAMLPPDLLAQLAARAAARARQASSGAGDKQRSVKRGRPLPSRPGRLDGTARIDVIATLRAAAPWQTLRAKASGQRLAFRPADIRVKRYEERSERILIFLVDASGSAAFSRLAEAKGAVELLLAEAYARRDQVALITFRGTEADLLLPPTRSLVQTKRRLAALPGGGGTPLAAGLKAALELALTERAKGRTPAIALLTDGRANIALDGEADRKQAAEDAIAMARAIRARGIAALVIDMGNRPEQALRALAAEIDAPYLPMPRADSARLSSAVSTALAE
ncbi:MAG: magnesium chelatase subunit D [Pseudomonadota bacterium]